MRLLTAILYALRASWKTCAAATTFVAFAVVGAVLVTMAAWQSRFGG